MVEGRIAATVTCIQPTVSLNLAMAQTLAALRGDDVEKSHVSMTHLHAYPLGIYSIAILVRLEYLG